MPGVSQTVVGPNTADADAAAEGAVVAVRTNTRVVVVVAARAGRAGVGQRAAALTEATEARVSAELWVAYTDLTAGQLFRSRPRAGAGDVAAPTAGAVTVAVRAAAHHAARTREVAYLTEQALEIR